MASRVAGSPEDAGSEPFLSFYTSQILKLFLEDVKRGTDLQVLDVGVVCGSNIDFFMQHVKKLYVCDLFLRLDRDRRKGLAPGFARRHLDYPPQVFDGVLLWDLIDRLEEEEGRQLVEQCHTMVKTGGKMMLFALNEQASAVHINSYVIGEDCQLEIRPHPHLNLPLYHRQNRDIMKMLDPFTPVKSFIYRSGLREFLFQNT